MSLMWIFYLANIADSVSTGLGIILAVLVIILLVGGVGWVICTCEDKKDKLVIFLSLIKKSLIFGIITLIIMSLIPSSNTIYLMAGTQQIEKLSTTEEGQKVKQALDLGLDKVIRNLKDGK
jgi:uncharacterized protein YhhL (DUF1145 family)